MFSSGWWPGLRRAGRGTWLWIRIIWVDWLARATPLVLIMIGIILLVVTCNSEPRAHLFVAGSYPWDNIALLPNDAVEAGYRHRIPAQQAESVLSDAPSVLLAITSLVSASLFFVLFGTLRDLPSALVDGPSGTSYGDVSGQFLGVLRDRGPNRVQILGNECDPREFAQLLKWKDWLVITITVGFAAIAVGFYFACRFAFYPANWWASKSIWLATLWIAIGGCGAWASAMQMQAYIRAINLLQRLRLDSADPTGRFEFIHLDRFIMPSRGWAPLWKLLRLKVLGFSTFIPAIWALYFIAIQRIWAMPIWTMIVVLVLIVTVKQFRILSLVPQLYEDSVDRAIVKNSESLGADQDEGTIALNARVHEHLMGLRPVYRSRTGRIAAVVLSVVTDVVSAAAVLVPALIAK